MYSCGESEASADSIVTLRGTHEPRTHQIAFGRATKSRCMTKAGGGTSIWCAIENAFRNVATFISVGR